MQRKLKDVCMYILSHCSRSAKNHSYSTYSRCAASTPFPTHCLLLTILTRTIIVVSNAWTPEVYCTDAGSGVVHSLDIQCVPRIGGWRGRRLILSFPHLAGVYPRSYDLRAGCLRLLGDMTCRRFSTELIPWMFEDGRTIRVCLGS